MRGRTDGRLTFWLLRHAKTVPDPPPGLTDHERVLAPRGRHDADALARRLADPGFAGGDRPGLVLCSTAARTVETAGRVLAGMEDPPPVEYRRALYGASPEEVLDQLRKVDHDVRTVMVVGHNPTVETLVAGMGRKPPPGRAFPTCALAVFRLPVDRWDDVAQGRATLLGLFVPPY